MTDYFPLWNFNLHPKTLTRVIGCYDGSPRKLRLAAGPKTLTRVIGCYDL